MVDVVVKPHHCIHIALSIGEDPQGKGHNGADLQGPDQGQTDQVAALGAHIDEYCDDPEVACSCNRQDGEQIGHKVDPSGCDVLVDHRRDVVFLT